MIIIISDSFDESTNHVIDWLTSYQHTFLRINPGEAVFRVIYYSLNLNKIKFVIECNNCTYDYDNIGSIWYRRGEVNFGLVSLDADDLPNEEVRHGINSHLHQESEVIALALFDAIKEKKSLNSLLDIAYINKLRVLKAAKKVGLLIPDTLLIDLAHMC